jgi:hypothetical protein
LGDLFALFYWAFSTLIIVLDLFRLRSYAFLAWYEKWYELWP